MWRSSAGHWNSVTADKQASGNRSAARRVGDAVVLAVLVLAHAGCGTALATRNRGVGMLAGTGFESAVTGKQPGEFIDGHLSAAAEVLYEQRLKKGAKIALHFDAPVIVLPNLKTAPINDGASRPYAALFLTPGLSLERSGRLSFFIGGGGGLVRLRAADALERGAQERTGQTAIRGAGHISSGYEFQITPQLGVRFNVRALFAGGPFPATGPDQPPVVHFSGAFGAVIHF